MRIFLGLDLPDRLKQALADRAASLRGRFERVAPRAAVRWVEPSNLHITIWFLGEVAEARIPEVTTAIGERYPVAAFDLRFGGVGAFPSPGRPRVIWTGISKGAEELAGLHEEVRRRVEPLGFEPERREYSAHLTLGRVKDLGRVDSRMLRAALLDPLPALEEAFRVESLTLFRSRLSPRGAQYERLLRVPLS